METSEYEIEGVIEMGPDVGSFEDAVLHLHLEEVSLADASAVPIASLRITGISHRAGTHLTVKFELPCDHPDPKAHYNVRAHVDLRGDGAVSQGDYVSARSFPVLTFGHPRRISITVNEVS